MRLLLIRHGETVDNVAGNLAGVTDSALTVHGVLQTQRLGKHLAEKHSTFAAVFSSDLSRAQITAQAIIDACNNTTDGSSATSPADTRPGPVLTTLPVLREQDFGSLEGKPWSSSRNAQPLAPSVSDHVPSETKASMDSRADTFIEDYILPLLVVEPEGNVAVVSHGILLSRLWKRLLSRCPPSSIHLTDNISIGPRGLEHLGAWSNTGVLELDVALIHDNEGASGSLDVTDHTGNTSQATVDDDSPPGAETEQTTLLSRPPATGSPPASPKLDIIKQSSIEEGEAVPAVEERNPDLRISLHIRAVNSTAHLASLKRTRGGIGSAKHDGSQGTLDTFFKRQRTK